MTNPLAEPERIAFAGDWHMNGPWARKAILHASEQGANVIVHLGDFGYTYDASFMRAVERALSTAGIPLLFVDGNHEAFPTLYRYGIKDTGLRQLTDRIWHLPRGFRWQWAGIRFLALGGAHSVDRPYREPGTSWWKDETITEEQAGTAMRGGRADVLVAHDCPSGVTIPGVDDRATPPPFSPLEIIRANEHRQVVRRVVDTVQPRWIWHGHYHRQYGSLVDLGYGPVTVVGLDCDETRVEANVQVVELSSLITMIGGGAS